MSGKVLTLPVRRQAYCPTCGRVVDALRGSPTSPRAHVVALIPCGCWVSRTAAGMMAAEYPHLIER